MRELIQRFRYCLDLRRRKQSDWSGLRGSPRVESLRKPESAPQLIERFRYRLELSRRDYGDEPIGSSAAHKLEALLGARSIPQLLIRSVALYLLVLVTLAKIGWEIIDDMPTARSTLFVVFIILVGIWTLVVCLGGVVLYKTGKRHQTGETKSPNRSLQPPAGRRTTELSHD